MAMGMNRNGCGLVIELKSVRFSLKNAVDKLFEEKTTFGDIFGYNGYFKAEFKTVKPGEIPAYAKPLREENRE